MGKNKYNKVYQDMSGKNSNFPGQLCIDVTGKNNGRYVEAREMHCSKDASKKYWNSLKEFLDMAGAFSRTWHLYRSVKDIDTSLPDHKLPPEQVKRLDIMRMRQNCKTVHDLAIKSNDEGIKLRGKLRWYLSCSMAAGVGLIMPEDEDAAHKKENDILNSFVSRHDLVRGDLRREYFREKYLKKAQKEIDEYGYSDPIGIVEMEEAFKADTKWQDKKAHKNQAKKEQSARKRSTKDPKT